MQSLVTGTARTIGPGASLARSWSTAADGPAFCVFREVFGRARRSPGAGGLPGPPPAPERGREREAEPARAWAAAWPRPVQRGGRGGGEPEPDGGHRRRQRDGLERWEPHGGKHSVGEGAGRRRDGTARRRACGSRELEGVAGDGPDDRIGQPRGRRGHGHRRTRPGPGLGDVFQRQQPDGRGDAAAGQPVAEQLPRPGEPAADRALGQSGARRAACAWVRPSR